jgi:hypothetical protein
MATFWPPACKPMPFSKQGPPAQSQLDFITIPMYLQNNILILEELGTMI